MKELSIIIVSWNACEFLRGCLNSIRTSGCLLVREIIVVDNASADGSAEMVATEFPEVTLIRSNENLGFARGNNLGIRQASGTWLALINSDVKVHPGCFEQLVGYLEGHTSVGLVGPRVVGRDGQTQPTDWHLPTVWTTACRSLALDKILLRSSKRNVKRSMSGNAVNVEVLSGCFWVVRREAVAQVGGLDERFFFYAEDLDWCKRFWDAKWKVVFVPGASATHFGGGSSAVAPFRYSIELLRANLAYWKKHHGVSGLGVFFFLSVIHHATRLLLRGMEMIFGRGLDSAYKCRRSLVCLRWLLTGRGIEENSVSGNKPIQETGRAS